MCLLLNMLVNNYAYRWRGWRRVVGVRYVDGQVRLRADKGVATVRGEAGQRVSFSQYKNVNKS